MSQELFSKTDYTNGCQCAKILWMERNKYQWEERDALSQSLIEGGEKVGALAREWAGGDVLIDQDFNFERMAAETKRYLRMGYTVCEATFTDGEHVCMVDICKQNHDGSIDIYEVKASSKVKPYHILDVSYQIWVCERCGYTVNRAYIVHLNGDYRLKGELNLDGMFALSDQTTEARMAGVGIEDSIARFNSVRMAVEEPDIRIGKHCNSPHACPFQKWCWRDVPEDSIFSLAGVGRVRGFKMWDDGVKTHADALACSVMGGKVKLNGLQAAQAKGEFHVNHERVADFLDNLHYPLYFLDFETVQPAVPIYEGTKVYQQIPTQYSLHWIDEPGGELRHAEYLAPSVGDPRRGVAENLVKDIPTGACVTAYNMSFERGRIKELAQHCSDLADRLMEIHDSIADLMIPFKSGWVYLPAMGGSYSIKKVLPALYPNDPELDYTNLDGVHNGSEAMQAFDALADMSKEEEMRTREQLLRYCELDTLAMVRVWEWLDGRAV